MRKFLLVLVISIYSITSCGPALPSQLGAFAFALNDVSSKVDEFIDRAKSAGESLEVTAGSQLQNLIITTRESYEKELAGTAGTLTAQQQQLISGLNSMLNNIESHILSDFTKSLQQIANTLPFANKMPQVTTLSGTIAEPGLDDARIVVSGNFPTIGQDNFAASLHIQDTTLTNSGKQTGQITFSIPRKYIRAAKNKVSYYSGKLDIPYEKKLFGGFKSATFLVEIIILPDTIAGKLVVYQNKAMDVRIDTSIATPVMIWEAGDGDVEKAQHFDAPPGWTIDIGSVVPHVVPGTEKGSAGKDWYNEGNASTNTSVGWTVKATHKNSPWGHNGAIGLMLTYRAYKVISDRKDFKIDTITLDWKNSKIITIDPQATWRMIFMQFDGKSPELASNLTQNPYLNITQAGNQLQIVSQPFNNELR